MGSTYVKDPSLLPTFALPFKATRNFKDKRASTTQNPEPYFRSKLGAFKIGRGIWGPLYDKYKYKYKYIYIYIYLFIYLYL